jgi:cobalt-zinc-cadmium efflux system outer membrane protein
MNSLFTQMCRTTFALVVLIGTVDMTVAQPLTLKSAINKTLKHNLQLHQFEFTGLRLLAERESLGLKPGLELSTELENFAGTGIANGLNGAELTVSLSSVIELGSKLESRLALSGAMLDKFEVQKQVQTLDVLGELTSTFIQTLTTQHELSLSSQAVTLSEALVATVQKRAKRGAASDAEVMRAKAMLAQSAMQRDNFDRKLERQKVSLARFWGDTAVDFSRLEGDLFAFGQTLDFASLYQKVKLSPALTYFASELRLKDAAIRVAESQNRADLSWQFGVRRAQESNDTGLTIGFSMPLFTKSRNRGSINAALAERNAVEYRRADRLLLLHEQLYAAYSLRQQYIDVHRQLESLVIPDLEKALLITRKAYDQGRLKYQDWITAQQELLSAKQQLIETAAAALLSQATIEQLTAESLTE